MKGNSTATRTFRIFNSANKMRESEWMEVLGGEDEEEFRNLQSGAST